MLAYAAAGANQRRLLLRRAAAGRLLKKLGRQDLSVLVAGLSAGRLAPIPRLWRRVLMLVHEEQVFHII